MGEQARGARIIGIGNDEGAGALVQGTELIGLFALTRHGWLAPLLSTRKDVRLSRTRIIHHRGRRQFGVRRRSGLKYDRCRTLRGAFREAYLIFSQTSVTTLILPSDAKGAG